MMKIKLIFALLFLTSLCYAGNVYMFELPDNSKYKVLPDFVLEKPKVKKVVQKTAPAIKKIDLKLNGIFKISGEYVALINGESYKKGDKIESYKIVKITMKSVTINNKGRKVTFYVEE